MSVVNKMLQDLEARKSQPDEINADYQPPQKQQTKWFILVLLMLAIAAITFALSDNITQLFKSKENAAINQTTKALPQVVSKKMMVMPQQSSEEQLKQPEPVKSAANSTISDADDKSKPIEAEIDNKALPNLDEKLESIAGSANNLIPELAATPSQPEVKVQATVKPEKQPSFTMSGSTRENQSTNLKQRIAESLNNNDPDLAQSLLSELLLDEPDNLKARKKLASLYFAQGNYAQTKQLLVRGIDLYPNQTDFRLMLARLYAMQEDTVKALQVMTGVEPSINNQTDYLAYRASLAQQLKKTQESRDDYLTLTQIESNNAKWWLGLAIAQDQLGEIKKALKAYDKAYSLGQLDDSVDQFIQQRISVLAGVQ